MKLPIVFSGFIIVGLLLASTGIVQSRITDQQDNNDDGSGCCVGLVATGKICKDLRSILWKNRHYSAQYQKPFFYKGEKYAFFGVGGIEGQCRMGMNEKGLSIANFDVSGPLDNWKYTSDGSSGSEDNDQKIPLGNFSTVADTAWWLAHHAYYGQGRQWGVISAERGVGAVVAVDTLGHSNITWVNDTYAVFANAYYCDGDTDPDGTDTRAKQLFEDLLYTPTSNVKNHGINWRDICQILATDTHDKEDGDGTFNYAGEISGTSAFSAMVAVSGTPLLHMAWINIGRTTQIGIFLPLTASYLKSTADIPPAFRDDDGIQPYVDVKYHYASAGYNQYYCDRVREIQRYAFSNENTTFRGYDILTHRVLTCTNKAMIKTLIKRYVENAVNAALNGYIHNTTTGICLSSPNGPEICSRSLVDFFPPPLAPQFVQTTSAASSIYSSHSFTKFLNICSPNSVCSTSG